MQDLLAEYPKFSKRAMEYMLLRGKTSGKKKQAWKVMSPELLGNLALATCMTPEIRGRVIDAIRRAVDILPERTGE